MVIDEFDNSNKKRIIYNGHSSKNLTTNNSKTIEHKLLLRITHIFNDNQLYHQTTKIYQLNTKPISINKIFTEILNPVIIFMRMKIAAFMHYVTLQMIAKKIKSFP